MVGLCWLLQKVDFVKQKVKSDKIIQSKHLIAFLGTPWDRKNHHFIKRVSRSLSSRGPRKINISSRRSVGAHYQWRKMMTFSKSESWKISTFWSCVLCVCHILSVLTLLGPGGGSVLIGLGLLNERMRDQNRFKHQWSLTIVGLPRSLLLLDFQRLASSGWQKVVENSQI